jgi:hypothetical protein
MALPTRRRGSDAIEDCEQRRPQAVKLFEMCGREMREPPFRHGGRVQKDAATIMRVVAALDQAGLGEPVGEFDRAVMADAQPLGKIADRRSPVAGKAFEGEERLVVAWAQPGAACGFLAERQKPADQIAEIGERFVGVPVEPWRRGSRFAGAHGTRIDGLSLVLVIYISFHDIYSFE